MTQAAGSPQAQDHLARPKYRADVDGLRAVAVLAVVGFHAFPAWVRGGYIGVDVFFVISGYLITSIILGSLQEARFSFAAFYGRRIRRIFPATFLVLAACYAFGWFALLPEEFRQLGKHIAGGAGFVSNLVLWREAGYFDSTAESKPLLHLWSLGIEEQFYIAWPLLLFLAFKLRRGPLLLILAAAVISFYLNVRGVRANPVGTFYSPATRVWELLAGAALAWLSLNRYQAVPSAWVGNAASVAGMACIVVAIAVLDKAAAFPGWWALLPTAGTALLIFAGPQACLNRALLANRFLVWIGLISFPLYLWHWPLLSFARIVESETPAREIRLLAVLASIVLAWLTYRFLEVPIRRAGRAGAKAGVLCALMVTLGLVGYGTWRRDGLADRFPQVIRDMSAITYDEAGLNRLGTCQLDIVKQTEKDFGDCTHVPTGKESGSIILWGDSHASALYHGLLARYGDRYRITQLATGGCPPAWGTLVGPPVATEHCNGINRYVLDRIAAERPVRVVLVARWASNEWRRVGETIAALKRAGVPQIDLVGPYPEWKDTLPRSLYAYFKQDTVLHRVPARMHFGLDPRIAQVDAEMRALAKGLQVRYLSAVEQLCDAGGCLTRLGDAPEQLTAWDYGHLTLAGSRFLVSRFPD